MRPKTSEGGQNQVRRAHRGRNETKIRVLPDQPRKYGGGDHETNPLKYRYEMCGLAQESRRSIFAETCSIVRNVGIMGIGRRGNRVSSSPAASHQAVDAAPSNSLRPKRLFGAGIPLVRDPEAADL